MYAATGVPNMKWEDTFFKWEDQAPLASCWRQPWIESFWWQFGVAVSATSRFGDGGCKCVMRKKCVFLKYFEGYSVFVVILMASVVTRLSGF